MKRAVSDLAYLEQFARVTEQPAPRSRFKFLKRFASRLLLHFIRGQNELNVHVANVLRALCDEIDTLEARVSQRIEGTEVILQQHADMLQRQSQHTTALASALAKRFQDSDVRQDAIVASLHATDVRLDELIARTDKVVESLNATDRNVAGRFEQVEALAATVEVIVQRQSEILSMVQALEHQVHGLVTRSDKVVADLHNTDIRIDEVVQRQDTLVTALQHTDKLVEELSARGDRLIDAIHHTDTRIDEVVGRQDALVESLRCTDLRAQELAEHGAKIVASVHACNERIDEVIQRQDEVVRSLERTDREVSSVSARQDALVTSLAATDRRIDETSQRSDVIVASLQHTDTRIDEIISRQDALVESLQQTNEQLHELAEHSTSVVASVHACNQRIDEVIQRQDEVVRSLERTDREVSSVSARQDALVDALTATDQRIDEVNRRSDAIVESLRRTDTRIDGIITRQDEIVASLARADNELNSCIRRNDEIVAAVHVTDQRIDGICRRHDALVESLERIHHEIQQVTARHDTLVASLHRTDERVDELVRRHEAMIQFASVAHEHAEQLRSLGAEVAILCTRVSEVFQRQDELLPQLARLQECLVNVSVVTTTLGEIGTRCDKYASEIERIRAELGEHAAQLTNISNTCAEDSARINLCVQDTQKLAAELRATVEEHLSRATALHARILREGKATKRAAAPCAVLGQQLVEAASPSFSAYQTYENMQRGPEELVQARLRTYVPWLQRAPCSRRCAVLDLGTGRGEFLEVLKEIGIAGYGVDINPCAVRHARAKGLDVKEMDLFSALNEVAPHSLGAVTAFHVIEHLSFPAITHLITLARRALRPNGLLIFETPNIFNLQIAASDFYKDPTHVRPVHPVTLDMWLKQLGFSRTHIEFIHPFPSQERLSISQTIKPEALRKNMRQLNQLLFGYRDCAIVAVADHLDPRHTLTDTEGTT